MNKFFLIAAMIIIANSFAYSQNAVIKGQIIDYNGEVVMHAKGKSDTVTVSNDGFFEFNIEATVPPLQGTIVYSDSNYFFFRINKGDTVLVTVSKDKNGKPVRTFEGDNAELNNCLSTIQTVEEYMTGILYDIAVEPFSKFEKEVDKVFDNVKPIVDKVPDDSLRNEMEGRFDAMRKIFKFYYTFINEELNNTPIDSNPDFMKFLESIDTNNRKVLSEQDEFFSYMRLLYLNLSWEFNRNKSRTKGSNVYIDLFSVFPEVITDRDVANFASEWLLDAYMMGGGDEYLDETVAMFEKINKNPEIQKKNKELAAKFKTVGPGREAPDFELIDADGNKKMLSDLRGKVLYIDVWATWCGPCLQELPPLAKLWEKYKDNPNIEFVSISVDESVDEWKAKLETDKPLWKSYRVEGGLNGLMKKLYYISGIPRFMLIDKDGKIINVNAPRPSNPTIEMVLDRYL